MQKLTFYPIDAIYKIKNGKAHIHLYGRTTAGKQICVIDPHFEPYFYVRPKSGDFAQLKTDLLKVVGEKGTIIRVEEVQKELHGKPLTMLKAFSSLPGAVPDLRKAAEHLPEVLSCYEYDVLFVKRYFIDKRLQPFSPVSCEGEFIEEESKVPVFLASSLQPEEGDSLSNIRILAFDIETYNPLGRRILPEEHPILMFAVYGKDFQRIVTYKKFETDNENIEFVADEKAMLERFLQLVEEYQPDILTGYFSDGFDFPYMETRARKHKVKLPLGLDNSQLSIDRRGLTEARVSGIAHFDVLRFVSRIFGRSLKTDSYKLDNVAAELLGEGKHDVDMERLAEVWDHHPDQIETYCHYNLQDSRITYLLAEKLLPSLQELVRFVGLPLQFVNRMSFSQLVEAFITYQTPDFNALIPNKPGFGESANRRSQRFVGAFVFEPKPGLYNDIVVFDFRSLYPTIITSHNIGPSTLTEQEDGIVVPELHHKFSRHKKGFLPTILENVIQSRMKVKEQLKKEKTPLLSARSNMLKLLANSFYGYYGFSAARWYSFECGQSITAFGRFYIKDVIQKARETGFHVIYSDTDSIFIALENKSKQDALDFVERINSDLPGLMELEYEQFFTSGIFVGAKGSDSGAKKKYALVNEEGKLKIRGFETVRRNVSFIAKEVQQQVLLMILVEKQSQEAFDYVVQVIDDLRRHRVPVEKLTIRTQITKDMSQYDSIGPHVAVANRMKEQGQQVGPGSIVEYVITKGVGPLRDRARTPEEITSEDYDGEYYVTNQVVPAVERIFDVLGFEAAELLRLKEQSKLAKFF